MWILALGSIHVFRNTFGKVSFIKNDLEKVSYIKIGFHVKNKFIGWPIQVSG